METVTGFIFLGSKITVDSDCSHAINTLARWKKSYGKPKQCIKKQKHHFADKGTSSQSDYFSNSHVWMWELDYKESWVSTDELVLLNCGVGEDSWESLGQQGDQTSQS